MKFLLDEGMRECQGPALWVYNNACFKEKDFADIIKLGGATKEHEISKIGKRDILIFDRWSVLLSMNSTCTHIKFSHHLSTVTTFGYEIMHCTCAYVTGKFGLGFNAVYNVTDVPSFVSGDSIVMFDPHTKHLGRAIRDRSKPG